MDTKRRPVPTGNSENGLNSGFEKRQDQKLLRQADLLGPLKIWRILIESEMRPDIGCNRKRNSSERDATALRCEHDKVVERFVPNRGPLTDRATRK